MSYYSESARATVCRESVSESVSEERMTYRDDAHLKTAKLPDYSYFSFSCFCSSTFVLSRHLCYGRVSRNNNQHKTSSARNKWMKNKKFAPGLGGNKARIRRNKHSLHTYVYLLYISYYIPNLTFASRS